MSAGRSGHALAVQVAHDRQRPLAGGVLAKDAAHDVGLGRVDGASSSLVAVLEHVVAVALAAGDAAGLDPADLAAARLLRQVLQEQRGHGALEADVDFRHRAVGEGLDAHAQELQPLVEGGDVGLAARQAVQALGDDHVEPAGLRIRDQAQQARPVEGRGARDGSVIVDLDHVQAAGLGIAPSEVDLVGDGAKVLQVAGEAGVDRSAHGKPPMSAPETSEPAQFSSVSSFAARLGNSSAGMSCGERERSLAFSAASSSRAAWRASASARATIWRRASAAAAGSRLLAKSRWSPVRVGAAWPAMRVRERTRRAAIEQWVW